MRVGTVCYATDQGIAHLAKWFYDNGVVTDVMVFRHGSRPTHMEWYPGATELVGRPFNGPAVDAWLRPLDVVLFFETPFDWQFPDYCRARGKRTALMPMHEWTPARMPHRFDRVLNPSMLDQQYFPHGTFLHVPVSVPWRERKRALHFVQNAGNIGCRGHKGVQELFQAVQHLKSDLRLTIRCQDTAGLAQLLRQCPWVERRAEVVKGSVPYSELFSEGDVYVAAEKLNGLSLPLQEAHAAGMCVLTTDRFPTNTWLKGPRIPVKSKHKARMGGAYLEFEECIVDPADIAAAMDALYGADISEYSAAGLKWAQENSWERLRPKYLEALA